jgi:hypothetical protein
MQSVAASDRFVLTRSAASTAQVMAHVSGDSRVVWEGVEREAAAGKGFVTPRVSRATRPHVRRRLHPAPRGFADAGARIVHAQSKSAPRVVTCLSVLP